MTRYGKTAWWWLCHVRDTLQRNPRTEHPPVQPYKRRSIQAVERLIDDGVFELVRREPDGRLYYRADLQTVLHAIEGGAPR